MSGSVRDDRGDVVVDAAVLVFPEDDARWTFASRFIRTTRPDTEGRFELAALPPSGAYRIVALLPPRGRTGLRSRVPGRVSAIGADRLSLNEGEAKAVELRLRP